MALSQQHPDLMVVPWFNSHEWRYVKNCLLGDDALKKEALDIIKIWKNRTPKLPSGVEGTLMLLEALLDHSKIESDEQRFNCYCYALLRFLNICCGQSGDKQTSFYYQAKKHNLPDWLVDQRHAIAHGQSLPGEPEIHDALVICLNLIKHEYWLKQDKTLSDYIKEDCRGLILITDLYCNITIDGFLNENAITIKQLVVSDSALREKILNLRQSCLIKLSGSIEGAKKVLLKVFRDNIENGLIEEASRIVIKYLLIDIPDLIQPDSISNILTILWKNLIDAFYEEHILLTLIMELLAFCNSSNFYELSEVSIKIASCWLKFIFDMLLSIKGDLNWDDIQKIPDFKHLVTIIGKVEDLQVVSLSVYNAYKSLYLPSLLKLGGHSQAYIENKIKEFQQMEVNSEVEFKVPTLSEICRDVISCDITSEHPLETTSNDDHILPMTESEMKLSEPFEYLVKSPPTKMQPRCMLITDSSMFENCPLGVLPTETRSYNPLIPFNY